MCMCEEATVRGMGEEGGDSVCMGEEATVRCTVELTGAYGRPRYVCACVCVCVFCSG